MRIAIVGAGRMGMWLAHTWAKDNQVAVYDCAPKDYSSLERVTVLNDLGDIPSFQPEMVVNAVSLQHTRAAFDSLRGLVPEDSILADIASVKGDLPQYYKESGRRYVSVHPMFGPTWASMDMLREENAIVINESDKAGREFFVRFFAHLGVKVFECSFSEHDSMMAYSLTTPFIASLVFASCVNQTTVPGTTFARHRRIADGLLGEDDHLISEILFNPRSLTQLDTITSQLEFLKHVIRARDFDEATKLFSRLRSNLRQK